VLDGTLQTVGVRFTGLTMPQGSAITTAWIQFETDEKKSGATSLTIRGQAAANPATFASKTNNISTRPVTAASVGWTPPAWTILKERGPGQRTPDLSPVLREIVGRPDWVSGNAVAFIITGTGVRTAEAFNGTRPPALHVEYLPPSTPNVAPTVNAGPDQTIRLPAEATLQAAAADDGLPVPPGATGVSWSTASGPDTAVFAGPTSATTTATFPVDGVYALRATVTDGALSASDDVVVTVLPADQFPPSRPESLQANVVNARRVDLTWAASSDDVGVVAYDVYRDGALLGSPTETAYTDAGTDPDSTYVYTVTARDAAGHTSDPSDPVSVITPAAPESVTFAAAGDFSANARTAASLARLDGSGAEFFLALGDLDYNDTLTDAAWCDYVKARLPTLGTSFPFELVSGNHEDDDGPDGFIMNHAACLPDRLGATAGPVGGYGAEYFADYPASAPLVRVIMTSPGLVIGGERYDYLVGDAHYTWLSQRIDEARAQGIPWVIVGMHHPCLSTGNHGCSISKDLHNLLIAKRVDLVLQGHDHNYQRSKQLATNPSTCPTVPTGSYDADCVIDTGADHTYLKGAGALFLIDGTFGKASYPINPADVQAPYFATADSTSNGFVSYTVTPDRLDATFVAAIGSYADTFSILPPGSNQPPAVNAGPDLTLVQPNAATLAGSMGDDGLPSGALTASWSVVSGPGAVTFGDPSAASTSATFSDPGTYVLRLTASDGTLSASEDAAVTVAAAGVAVVLDIPVGRSADDAEEVASTGAVSLSSSDLELINDGSDQVVGMRFAGVQIPAGSQVTAAWVQFETDELKSVTTSLTVRAQAADDALSFTTSTFNVSSRPRTLAFAPWTPPAWTILQERGAGQRTPDLAAVLQEVVSRPGWASGYAMAIVVTGTGVRTAEAFDGTAPPVLHVEFLPPA